MKKTLIISLIFLASIALPGKQLHAQGETPSGPIYIVQSGDTLFTISVKFGIPMNELITANQLSDPDMLAIGQEIILPGFGDLVGILTTDEIGYGETLSSMSRRLQIPKTTLMQLNRIVSPTELYVGYQVINFIPDDSKKTLPSRMIINHGMSLLESAVLANSTIWSLMMDNQLQGSWDVLPGDLIYYAGIQDSGPSGFPPDVTSLKVTKYPFKQGGTFEISIEGGRISNVSGTFLGYTLHFFPQDQKTFVALQGVHAMAETGVFPLQIELEMEDGEKFHYVQNMIVRSGGYLMDPVLNVDPVTIDPKNTKPEDDLIKEVINDATPEKLWEGSFSSPAVYNDCVTSPYGRRRSYNGSPYIYFHSGVDFCGGKGLDIYAPASGIVVFAESLTVRGNITIIDHGWGIYSTVMHQNEILVGVGEKVERGQLIGKVGETGRVTGAHLHFELWVGGVQVDPMDWLEIVYP